MTYITLESGSRARAGFLSRYWTDLARYRHLAFNLVGADLRSRFRRSRLGIIWAGLQPAAFAFVIAYVLHLLVKQPFEVFFIYVMSGFIVWEFIAAPVNGGVLALQNAAGYLRQARIPLLVFQLRVPLSVAVMFCCAFVCLIVLQYSLGVGPALGLHTLLVVPFLALAVLFACPVAIIFSYLGTIFRDLVHISAIALQALWMTSPVMLPRELFASRQLAWLQETNPAIALIDLFRDPMVHGRWWQISDLATLGVWIVLLWVVALILGATQGRRVIFKL